ncbi:hypothetical protein M422DRAFT_266387 [Sphaerobolus stellatus SS14]|uniref:DUF6534 domain-containing protein n=1 Tax=Sphaerobolus stellatus (strain SS14) TaxID=990650 RepID=A0A0C9UBC0_SPHS4|nr:hypothetical protein M422DRAFT_266387 [Sphaerobolus stellatus SS14]
MAVIVINTGLSTAVAAMLVIVTLLIWPHLEIFTIPYAAICPLYCNTILANLNSRAYMRPKTSSSFIMPPPTSVMEMNRRDRFTTESNGVVYPLSIFVETTTETDRAVQQEGDDDVSHQEQRSTSLSDKGVFEGGLAL